MADLEQQLALTKRSIDRLPLCPDHRDTVQPEPCLKCVNASLLEALEEAVQMHVNDIYPRATLISEWRAAIARAKGERNV